MKTATNTKNKRAFPQLFNNPPCKPIMKSFHRFGYSVRNLVTGLSSIITVGVLMFEAYLMWGPSSPPVSPAAAGHASPAAQQALDTEFSKAAAQVDVPPASPPLGAAKTPKAEPAKAGNPEQALWSAFSDARHQVQSLTQEESAMAHNKGVRFFAANPGQQLTARFLDEAVRIESGAGGSWQGEMQLTAISKGERALALPKPSAPHAKGSRVEYQRGSVVEWYENMPEGFEHGYVIQEPVADGDAPLRVEVRMHGMVSRLTTPRPTRSCRHGPVTRRFMAVSPWR